MNPARSTGVAVFVGGWALAQLRLFWIALIARAFLPGGDRMGFLATTAAGILGSLLGGFLGGLIEKPAEGAKLHPAGFFMSVVGAMLLLLLLR